MLQIVFTIGKDGTLESKTTCFTLSDGSDIQKTSITPYNKLTINKLQQIVIDNQKNRKTKMAVHIKLIKNNIKSSSSYGKYFAKAVIQFYYAIRIKT